MTDITMHNKEMFVNHRMKNVEILAKSIKTLIANHSYMRFKAFKSDEDAS